MRSNRYVWGTVVCLASSLQLVNCSFGGDGPDGEAEASVKLRASPAVVASVAGVLRSVAPLRGPAGAPVCGEASVAVTGGRSVRTVVASEPSCTPGAVPSFRFVVVAPNNAETVLHDWSPRSQVFWNVGGLHGIYRVRLEVRASQNLAQRPAQSVTQLGLGKLCSDPTLVGFGSGYATGEPVPMRATASCGAPEFRFLVRPVAREAWEDACGRWTRSGGCDWVPPEAWGVGGYEAKVQSRWAGAVGIEFEGESAPYAFSLGVDDDCDGSDESCEP